jgi:CO/xanthine dehydrogenase Mo-binding subunit
MLSALLANELDYVTILPFIAGAERFYSVCREAYVSAVAEVEVNKADGQVRVKRVVIAHDCALIVNPDGLRNQIEGNVIQATNRTLKEEVKFDPSMVTSLDWTSYLNSARRRHCAGNLKS